MSRAKSKLTKKDMLLMIIKQRGGCDGISSIHCQGGGTSSQRYTQCPIKCLNRCPLPNEECKYEIALNKCVKDFGQETIVEALM